MAEGRERQVAVPHVLREEDREAAAAVFAHAFKVEPGVVAMFPDEGVRERMLVLNGLQVVDRAVARATAFGVDRDGSLAAVAVWDPPGAGIELPSLGDLPNRLERLSLVARHASHLVALGRRHRRELLPLVRERRRAIQIASAGPTWHLSFLGTHPDHQGQGLARRLLEHVLDRCDTDGLASWLETTDPVNPPIYERFGFRAVAHLERAGWLPGFWVMRREPGAGGSVGAPPGAGGRA